MGQIESNEIFEKKREIRKDIIRRLRDQDPSLRKERSLLIQQKLLSSEEFKAAGTVMTYVSMPTEVSTKQFIKEALKLGKRVAAPHIRPQGKELEVFELNAVEDLEEGPYGIKQPKNGPAGSIPLREIDLIVVPAIAYDRNNMRLGRGKGYYDQFFSREELSSATTIGLAFSFQLMDSIPHDSHDRPVSRVISD